MLRFFQTPFGEETTEFLAIFADHAVIIVYRTIERP